MTSLLDSHTRRHWLAQSLGISAASVLTGCAATTPLHKSKGWQQWGMPGVQVSDIEVPAVPGQTGFRVQRLMVYTPAGPVPDGGFPVIYTLDGNLSFTLVAQAMHNRGSRGMSMRGPSAIVVGIGQGALPEGEVHDRAARTYDYTPPYPGVGADSQGRMQGGADFFIDFLEQQVQPLIAQQFPANLTQQTLMGHSFGGLLCLHVLCTRTEMFSQYVAASPSLWWGNGVVLASLDEFAERYKQQTLKTRIRLHLSVGSEEGKHRPANLPKNPDSAAALQKMAANGGVAQVMQKLVDIRNLQCSHSVWQGADHGGSMYFACRQVATVGVEWS